MSQVTHRAWAEIDLNAIQHNVTCVRQHIGAQAAVMAMVKADAYGHGLLPVARAALQASAAWLGVATVAEGIALRKAGVGEPIALLCAFAPGEAEAILHYRLTPVLGDASLLQALLTARKRAAGPKSGRSAGERASACEVHLEIETGMGRAGALPEEAVALWREATGNGLRVTGLCTHFADADGEDEALTRQQEERFRKALRLLETAGARFDLIHLSNSAATWRGYGLPAGLVRPGLLLYGIRPPHCEPESDHAAPLNALRPALTLKARIASVRELPQGHTISYGATYVLSRRSRVATVLIGYGDGYPRRLSNRGAMLVCGELAPILGRVCMDQTVVDVTDIPGVTAGDEVVCIGKQGARCLTVETLARQIEATEHELTTALTARIPRLYKSDDDTRRSV